jgi:hypothetical protein
LAEAGNGMLLFCDNHAFELHLVGHCFVAAFFFLGSEPSNVHGKKRG